MYLLRILSYEWSIRATLRCYVVLLSLYATPLARAASTFGWLLNINIPAFRFRLLEGALCLLSCVCYCLGLWNGKAWTSLRIGWKGTVFIHLIVSWERVRKATIVIISVERSVINQQWLIIASKDLLAILIYLEPKFLLIFLVCCIEHITTWYCDLISLSLSSFGGSDQGWFLSHIIEWLSNEWNSVYDLSFELRDVDLTDQMVALL